MKHVNMNELIGKIRQWGVDRYICGPEGEGTLGSQLNKAQEELQEAFDALYPKNSWATSRDKYWGVLNLRRNGATLEEAGKPFGLTRHRLG